MVNPNTITTPETTMSQEERDKAYDKAQEEAWASQNQSQVLLRTEEIEEGQSLKPHRDKNPQASKNEQHT